jgi:hypothetical protein
MVVLLLGLVASILGDAAQRAEAEGFDDLAIRAYLTAQRLAPDDPRACAWGNGAVRSVLSYGRREEARDLVLAQAARHPVGACGVELASLTRRYASLLFAERGDLVDLFPDAQVLFDVYFRDLPDDGHYEEAAWSYAQLLEARTFRERGSSAALVGLNATAAVAFGRITGVHAAEAASHAARAREQVLLCMLRSHSCGR